MSTSSNSPDPGDRIVDYIVVGAGSAGCVAAERLSACGKFTVLVLEAGKKDSSMAVRVPAAVTLTAGSPQYDWCSVSQPDPTRDGRIDPWPRGKIVGGGSSINGQLYVRGQPADFDRWASSGNEGWGYQDILPIFKQLETYHGSQLNGCRGTNGPLSVGSVRGPHLLSEAFVSAADQVGVHRNPDYNSGSQFGASIAQVTQKRGWRHSASKAFLTPNLGRSNLQLETRATVRKIQIDNGVATGVHYQSDSGPQFVAARREVVVSAGTAGSPHLLMISGIGPSAELDKFGIELHCNLPGVGKNLQEHAGVWIINRVAANIRSLNMDYNLVGGLRHGLRFLLSGSGPIASPTAQAVAFAKSSSDQVNPDIQIHFAPLGYRVDAQGVTLLDHPAMLCVANVCNPQSRGEIRLASPDPEVAPLILPRLLDTPSDISRLIAGCKIARDILAAPALAAFSEEELFPGQQTQTSEQWEQLLRQAAGPTYHMVGTCAMGTHSEAVVDPRLRVQGVKHLRVADASIMPTITSGNTNAPTMMIGAQAAKFIVEEAMSC